MTRISAAHTRRIASWLAAWGDWPLRSGCGTNHHMRARNHGKGGSMNRRNLMTTIAVVTVLAVVAAGCSKKSTSSSGGGSASGGPTVDCSADPFGCVTVASGAPIKIGTLLSISGDTASLGNDSNAGVTLAIDHLDGSFDGKLGQIDGHSVTVVKADDGCSADGGQTGGTQLAADPQIVAVVGTTCSSSALGVADKIFSDKGIVLISPSNTGPALTAQGTHQPFYLRTAHNDKIQGAVVADFVKTKLAFTSAATIHDESPYSDQLAAVFRDDFAK